MKLHLLNRAIAAAFAAVFLLSFVYQAARATPAEGVQMEFPEGGRLRIENDFGNVTAESWQQNFVLINTSDVGNRSVVIENRNQTFVIRVQPRPGAQSKAIDLSVKLPRSARLEIVTGRGGVSLQGVPASATVKSLAGDVRVGFVDPANADIVARTAKGSVTSTIPQLTTENGHVLQARVGTGERTLRLDSVSGNISLSQLQENPGGRPPFQDQTLEPPRKAAGTPAPALDTQDLSEGDVIRVDSQLVTLNMSVIDRKTNRGLMGLTKSDFRLFENGSEQEILQFDSSSAPFDLILLIDLSGSTRDVVKLIRAAALRFVDAARPSDRIGVITFAGRANVISAPTLSRETLRDRINGMETAAGDTKLYDALQFALHESVAGNKTSRRTAIILMSDGLDGNIPGVQGDGSQLSYKELLSDVGEFEGVLYTLWLNTVYESLSPLDTQPEAFDAGYDRMKEMADVGGGVFYEVERLEDLAGAYERVVADLGTVYSLAYRPSDKTRNGSWRAIKVNVTTHPSAVARGKHGYYAN